MSTSEPPIPSKFNYLDMMLDEFPIVDVHFRTGDAGVVIPGHTAQGPIQMFQYRKDLPDLDIGPLGISSTLMFTTGQFLTFVPWDAIFAIFAAGSMETGYVWHEDQPAKIVPPPSGLQAALQATSKLKAANHLRLVPLDGPQEELTEPRLTIHDLRVIQGGQDAQEEEI